nr:hypothetical protein [Haloferax larsenii]
MKKRLDLDGASIRVFSEELVYLILFVLVRILADGVAESFVHFVDCLLIVVHECQNPISLSLFTVTEAEPELARIENGTSSLFESDVGVDVLLVPLGYFVPIPSFEEHNS